MNEEDKEATREDDTQSFEALETRLRTPKRGAREPPKGFRKERHSNKENLPLETDTHSIHREEIGTLPCMSRSTSMSDIQVKAECQRDPPVSILRSTSLLTLPGATCSQEVQTSVSTSDLVPARESWRATVRSRRSWQCNRTTFSQRSMIGNRSSSNCGGSVLSKFVKPYQAVHQRETIRRLLGQRPRG